MYLNSSLKKWVAFGLLVLLIQASVLPLALAENIQSKNLKQLQYKKQTTQKKIKKIEQIQKQLKYKSASIASHIVKNQQRLESAETTLETKQKEFGTAQKNLSNLQIATKQAEEAYEGKKKIISKRIRRFYMEERVGLLQLILDAPSLASLLDRVYYKQRIYDQDKKLIGEYIETIEILNLRRQAVIRQKNRLKGLISSIQRNQQILKKAIDADRDFKAKLDKDIRTYEYAQQQLESESRSIESDIMSLVTRQSGKNGGVIPKSTGIFSVPASGAIRSGFGYRVHPIFKTRKMHTGLDFGAPYGSAVRAADGGTVLYAGWRGGYGKTVIINHGNRNGANITTLYGHLSSINVGNGQAVGKGQTVGRVGSTGYSTGPHLHFEVRLNGSPVDPMRYLR